MACEETRTRIVNARIKMMVAMPFWGSIAATLDLVEVDPESRIKTLATNGDTLYYNPAFIKTLSAANLIWSVAHEVDHIVKDHIYRRGLRDAKYHNYAADYEINLGLEDMHIGTRPTAKTGSIDVCFDRRFEGMTSDEIYDIIYKEQAQHNDFDVHLEIGPGEGASSEERFRYDEAIRSMIMQAEKADGGKTSPEYVRRYVAALRNPELDWREVIASDVAAMAKSDFTWERSSRKGRSMGLYLPSSTQDNFASAAVAIDTSCSMTEDMLLDQVSEIYGAMSQFAEFEIHVWSFDTRVHNYRVFTRENAEEFRNYVPEGGGGTMFECNWEFMKEKDIKPKQFIMMTDGEPNATWGDPDYCDTTFIVHSDTARRNRAPFGRTVWYK